ncbi:MAG TPA: SRPBCC domain-containing protein [Candidatus Synoicihabitans sp.]|nr:SRPBCC domain-containing protein [Candidatus Synoicihabitans sp.]
MADIIHRIGIKASPAEVYAAVSTVEGIASWWTEETSGESGPEGSIQVRFRNPAGKQIGHMTFSLSKRDPAQAVHWRFAAGPAEWVGTDATFDLSRDGDTTIVLFGHRNWREASEFTAHCSMKWATFLLSLRQLLETGKGRPSPHDLKIDNWN